MNKKLCISLLLSASIFLTACGQTESTYDVQEGTKSRFIVVEDGYVFDVVYDRYTKVMYGVAVYGSGSGDMTVLVDETWQPLLYNSEEYK